jgi:hypothetical protein
MPTPSKATPNTTTPPRQPQVPGQSNLDGFLRVSRPQFAPNDNDDAKENHNSNVDNTPLLRRRRIRDDDDDDDVLMVNSTLPNSMMNPVVVADTENESDANFAVILQPSHVQSAEGSGSRQSRSRRTQSPAPTECAVTVRPV